jgi:hypothetical protein
MDTEELARWLIQLSHKFGPFEIHSFSVSKIDEDKTLQKDESFGDNANVEGLAEP